MALRALRPGPWAKRRGQVPNRHISSSVTRCCMPSTPTPTAHHSIRSHTLHSPPPKPTSTAVPVTSVTSQTHLSGAEVALRHANHHPARVLAARHARHLRQPRPLPLDGHARVRKREVAELTHGRRLAGGHHVVVGLGHLCTIVTQEMSRIMVVHHIR